ncbi:MAG: hypothetical protein V4651_07040 [Bacteroidota bacterium]
MKQFLHTCLKFSLIGVGLMACLIIGYILLDPFRIIYRYNDFSYPSVVPNRDYISTEMLIQNQPRHGYNSFILGSSRTLAFGPDEWRKYLNKDANPYMFDASSESTYGIYTKLKFLETQHIPVQNALIILCRDASFLTTVNDTRHLFIKHPLTSGESPYVFHWYFLKAYLNTKFLSSLYTYTFNGNMKPYMYDYIETRRITYDTITNQIHILDQEKEISENPIQYYLNRSQLFYARNAGSIDPTPRINPKHAELLSEIKRMLEQGHSNYKVVLSPLYDQVKFNPEDLIILKNIFGEHLYNFSGKNAFTDSISNYYEASHYRPNVGDSIYKVIYKKPYHL